jgi:hypothetical protein
MKIVCVRNYILFVVTCVTFGIRKVFHIDGAVYVAHVYNDIIYRVCTAGKYVIQMITVLNLPVTDTSQILAFSHTDHIFHCISK